MSNPTKITVQREALFRAILSGFDSFGDPTQGLYVNQEGGVYTLTDSSVLESDFLLLDLGQTQRPMEDTPKLRLSLTPEGYNLHIDDSVYLLETLFDKDALSAENGIAVLVNERFKLIIEF